jgi:hypothetical protein
MGIKARAKKSDISFWQDATEFKAKVQNGWRPVIYGAVKVNGNWEPFFTNGVKRFRETHTNDTITFTWDQISGVTNYQFWVSEKEYGSSSLTFVKYADITPTLSAGKHTYTYTTEREKDYYFYIVPLIGTTPGNRSGYIYRRSPVGPPPPITDLQLISNDPKTGSFRMQWTNDSRYNPAGYRYYDDGGSPYQYTVTGVSGQNKVIAKNQLGVNTVTGISVGWGVSGTGIATGATIVSINPTTRELTLSANNTGTVSGYIIFYPPIVFKNNFSSSDATYIKSIASAANVEYKVKIQAFNLLGEGSGLSNQIEYQYTPISYNSLFRTSLTGTVTGWNTLNLTWTADSANVDRYDILYTTGTVYTPLVSNIPGSSNSRSVSLPNASTTYKIKLVAYGKALNGVVWRQSPVESTRIVNFTTGTPASSSTTRTNGTDTLNYTGTSRRRVTITVIQQRLFRPSLGFYWVDLSRNRTTATESVSYSEGGFYDTTQNRDPANSNVYYPISATRRYYFLIDYDSYVSNYSENYSNTWNIDSVLQDPSYGGRRDTTIASGNNVRSTVSGGTRRSKITTSYHYNTTTTIVAVNGTITYTAN